MWKLVLVAMLVSVTARADQAARDFERWRANDEAARHGAAMERLERERNELLERNAAPPPPPPRATRIVVISDADLVLAKGQWVTLTRGDVPGHSISFERRTFKFLGRYRAAWLKIDAGADKVVLLAIADCMTRSLDFPADIDGKNSVLRRPKPGTMLLDGVSALCERGVDLAR